MKYTNRLVFLVATIALAILTLANVSAFGSITSVEVSGVQAISGSQVAIFAGQTIPVRVIFSASSDATDVRIKTWISGESENAVVTERFDAIAGNVYSRLLSVEVPSNINRNETFKLNVVVESRNSGTADQKSINLLIQRESYNVNVLDVLMDSKVNAGDNLALDVVLKNRGRQMADDTFVKASIPALGVEKTAYFGDLSSVDQANPDKEDAAEKRMILKVPADAPSGVYAVKFEVYNSDSTDVITKRLVISGTGSTDSDITITGNTVKSTAKSSSVAVLLTVILAIIFIVLVVVLIVLLTRRSETKEEYGESYY